MLLAVGDGNHSLATAKAYWNEIRETLSPAERATHPARFAMCEIENIHDEALLFEPIHRLLSGTDPALLLSDWAAYAAARSMTLSEEGDGHSFFRDVLTLGVLPRKTFSMGEAHEKRYYMECRRILPEA